MTDLIQRIETAPEPSRKSITVYSVGEAIRLRERRGLALLAAILRAERKDDHG